MRSPRKSVALGLTLVSAMLAMALGGFWPTYGAYGLTAWPKAPAIWAMPVVLTVERRLRVKPNP
jgi:hypothetical protein